MFRILPAYLAILLTVGCGVLGGKDSEESDTATNTTSSAVSTAPLQYTPIVTFEQYPFQDFPVRSYIPAEPKGVVFVFHGSSGGIGFARKIETIAVLNELILEDIGFILTESTNRQSGQWDTNSPYSSNPDLQRLDALYDLVIQDTSLTANTAVFTLGFSNGGGMAGHMGDYALGEGWPISGMAPHASGCAGCWGTTIPTFWASGINDPQDSESASNDLADRGIPTQHHIIPELTISGSFFTKDPSVTESKSQSTFDELVELAMVDADGVRLTPIDDAEQQCEWYQNNGSVGGASARADDVRVAWALHRMNGYYARELAQFFVNQI